MNTTPIFTQTGRVHTFAGRRTLLPGAVCLAVAFFGLACSSPLNADELRYAISPDQLVAYEVAITIEKPTERISRTIVNGQKRRRRPTLLNDQR